jgi:hypothetical protein
MAGPYSAYPLHQAAGHKSVPRTTTSGCLELGIWSARGCRLINAMIARFRAVGVRGSGTLTGMARR